MGQKRDQDSLATEENVFFFGQSNLFFHWQLSAKEVQCRVKQTVICSSPREEQLITAGKARVQPCLFLALGSSVVGKSFFHSCTFNKICTLLFASL